MITGVISGEPSGKNHKKKKKIMFITYAYNLVVNA